MELFKPLRHLGHVLLTVKSLYHFIRSRSTSSPSPGIESLKKREERIKHCTLCADIGVLLIRLLLLPMSLNHVLI